MGLFITEDGHFQGWLAALLCCCAAVNDDESPIEKERIRAAARTAICNEQPQPLALLPYNTSTQALVRSNDDEARLNNRTGNGSRVSDRPPSLKPLDLGDDTWIDDKPGSLVKGSRPTISAPYAFRRLDQSEAQRQSLVPLKLGPVVLREMPVPLNDAPTSFRPRLQVATHDQSDSTQDLLPAEGPDSYRATRGSPFERCQHNSSSAWQPSTPTEQINVNGASPSIQTPTPTRPPLSSRSSTSSLRRQAVETYASSVSSRTSSERLRSKRKRSLTSVRRPYADSGDQELDKEILELNTIVEERRAENARENTSYEHVAAVAPSMPIRARSETLDAIGSVFSRPIGTAQSSPRNPTTPTAATSERPEIRRSMSGVSWTNTRLSGWLSGVLPSPSHARFPDREPFYKCQPPARPLRRTHSEASISSYISDVDSPSFTVTSSPTSKSHSRSQTGESRVTPSSPLTIWDGEDDVERNKACTYGAWQVRKMTPSNQVGIAL